MANSKYEYVKAFEVEDEVMFPNWIVVRIDGRNFNRFSEVHSFQKPNDEQALNLMNSCATTVLEAYPDIAFAYGFRDEFSFIFKQETKFYQRRASKILSVIASFFTSVFVTKWNEFFPKELMLPPSFRSWIISCASMEVLQAYLIWRQRDCHNENMYNTCLWMLIKSGTSEREAREKLKGTREQDKQELLFQFGINYDKLRDMFRQGSCVLKKQVEEIVKYDESGIPVKRMRKKVTVVHSEKIASEDFWDDYLPLLKEMSSFVKDLNKINPEKFVKSFQFENKLMPCTWIVIRIDGCHFHRFSRVHEFVKPNDEQALNLMNLCAISVVEEFSDIVFAYGVSDEYSFVLKKDSQHCQRRASEIVSIIVSFFSSMYVMKWKELFPLKELKCTPYFDGRAVCYPSSEILRDYLAWRQVDCHINNQYNTCFWMLVRSGKSKSTAQNTLKGTQAQEKCELLKREFGIDYDTLPTMFRKGSSIFWDKEDTSGRNDDGGAAEKSRKKVVVKHCDIIEDSFWKAHPSILDQKMQGVFKHKRNVNFLSVNFELTTTHCPPCSAKVHLFSGTRWIRLGGVMMKGLLKDLARKL